MRFKGNLLVKISHQYMIRIYLVLIASSLLSCASQNINSNEITELDYFQPIAYINQVYAGNNGVLNDSLSNLASKRMDSVIRKNAVKYRINRKLDIEDSSILPSLEIELFNVLVAKFLSKRTENNFPTPTIDSILKANNSRFAMMQVITGFERTEKEYEGELSNTAEIGLLSLRNAVSPETPWSIRTYTVIFDSKSNMIAFSKQTELNESQPTKPSVLLTELSRTFRYYF